VKRIITKITHRSTDWGLRVFVDGEEYAAGSTGPYIEAAELVWAYLRSLDEEAP
jgi:hypothetical protein